MTMDFGDVVRAMKADPSRTFARSEWLYMGKIIGLQRPDEHSANTMPYIWIRTAYGDREPWVATQADMLADDWYERKGSACNYTTDGAVCENGRKVKICDENENLRKAIWNLEKKHDSVNSPSHYCKGGFELGEVLYAWNLPHRRASAVEYIMRAGDKDPAKEREDLRKAIRNLEMELDYMERYGDHHAGRSHRQALQRPDAVVPLVSGRRKGARRIHHTGRGADGCHKSGMRGSDGDMRDSSRSALGGADHREVRNRAIGKPLSKPFPSCAALHNFAFRCKV